MNMGHLYHDALAKRCRQGDTILTTGTAFLEASTNRYIQRLEEEVRELTQQYNTVSLLLYRTVCVRDVSVVAVEECEARRCVVEAEAVARSDLVWLFFRITTMRQSVDSAVVSLRGEQTAWLRGELATTCGELPERIARALCGPLQREQERFLRLLETVPQQVCNALAATETAVLSSSASCGKERARVDVGDADVCVALQRLECMMTGVNELVSGLCRRQATDAGEERASCPEEECITALQNAVKSLEDSSRRLTEVLQRHEDNALLRVQPSSPSPSPPPPLAAAAVASPLSPTSSSSSPACSPSKELKVSPKLPDLTQRAVAALDSLMTEYMFFREQMQMVAEQEMSLLWSAHNQKNMMRWNCQSEEQASDIRRLQSEVDKLKSQAVAGGAKCDTSTTVATTNAAGVAASGISSDRARLYAKFAAPFIPPNVRTAPPAQLQSIAKLREEALRVGAHPVSVSPAAPAAATDTTATTRKRGDVASPASDTCKLSSSSAAPLATGKKSAGALPETQPRVSSSVSTAALPAPGAMVTTTTTTATTTAAVPAVGANDCTVRAYGGGEKGMANFTVRKFREKSTTSSQSTGSDATSAVKLTPFSSPTKVVSEAQSEGRNESRPLVRRSSFDESSRGSTLVIKRKNGPEKNKSPAGDSVRAFFSEKKEETDGPEQREDLARNSFTTSLSVTSLTLSFDDSCGKRKQVSSRAVAGTTSRVPAQASSFHSDSTIIEREL